MSRRVIRVTHDDFPLESLPPQGKITLHFSNGDWEWFRGTMKDYIRWEKYIEEQNKLDKKCSDMMIEYFPDLYDDEDY